MFIGNSSSSSIFSIIISIKQQQLLLKETPPSAAEANEPALPGLRPSPLLPSSNSCPFPHSRRVQPGVDVSGASSIRSPSATVQSMPSIGEGSLP